MTNLFWKVIRAVSPVVLLVNVVFFVSAARAENETVERFREGMSASAEANDMWSSGKYLEALEQLEKCSADGHQVCTANLCIKYNSQSPISESLDRAVGFENCLAIASAESCVSRTGSHLLGMMYVWNKGLPKPESEAKRSSAAAYWFTKAAECEEEDSMYMLGLFHLIGRGVPRDFVLAYQWFSLASAHGADDARDRLNEVEKLLTREEISEAQKRTRDWRPRSRF